MTLLRATDDDATCDVVVRERDRRRTTCTLERHGVVSARCETTNARRKRLADHDGLRHERDARHAVERARILAIRAHRLLQSFELLLHARRRLDLRSRKLARELVAFRLAGQRNERVLTKTERNRTFGEDRGVPRAIGKDETEVGLEVEDAERHPSGRKRDRSNEEMTQRDERIFR